jgi:hypothetical protein
MRRLRIGGNSGRAASHAAAAPSITTFATRNRTSFFRSRRSARPVPARIARRAPAKTNHAIVGARRTVAKAPPHLRSTKSVTSHKAPRQSIIQAAAIVIAVKASAASARLRSVRTYALMPPRR